MTPTAERWYRRLPDRRAESIAGVIDALEVDGPALRRPLADTLKGSRYRNLKELRLGTARVLFAFDRRRRGVILVGGDKAGNWEGWYRQHLPEAERLLERHLQATGQEARPWRIVRSRPGVKSVDRDR